MVRATCPFKIKSVRDDFLTIGDFWTAHRSTLRPTAEPWRTGSRNISQTR